MTDPAHWNSRSSEPMPTCPFLRAPGVLDIWLPQYFNDLANRMAIA